MVLKSRIQNAGLCVCFFLSTNAIHFDSYAKWEPKKKYYHICKCVFFIKRL